LWVARRLSRRDFDVFRFGTAIARSVAILDQSYACGMRDQQRFATAQAEGQAPPSVALSAGEPSDRLAREWRRLTRAATFVAVLTSPAAFIWFHEWAGIAAGWSLLWTCLGVIAFRGVVDVALRRFLPWPTLFGHEDRRVQEEDVVNRRRAWYWRKKIRLAVWVGLTWAVLHFAGINLGEVFLYIFRSGLWIYLIIFPLFFIGNFLIMFGPLVFMGISQMRAYEPGDADWGVKLEDVRGQTEA
jgi:hypothetical protein